MKTIARSIPLTLFGRQYEADLLLGLYATTKRPAIILVDSRPATLAGERAWEGAPIAIASSNAPEEYIQHLSHLHFPAKDWSENEGLWEQLTLLTDDDGFPLFARTRHAITLGFCKAIIFKLGPHAATLYHTLSLEQETFHG